MCHWSSLLIGHKSKKIESSILIWRFLSILRLFWKKVIPKIGIGSAVWFGQVMLWNVMSIGQFWRLENRSSVPKNDDSWQGVNFVIFSISKGISNENLGGKEKARKVKKKEKERLSHMPVAIVTTTAAAVARFQEIEKRAIFQFFLVWTKSN